MLERWIALNRVDPNNEMDVEKMNATPSGRRLVETMEHQPVRSARETLVDDFRIDLKVSSWTRGIRRRARPRSRRPRSASSRSSSRSGDPPDGSSEPPGVSATGRRHGTSAGAA